MTEPAREALKDCDCPDWTPNVDAINAPIILQTARSGGAYQYGGKPFVFCPWCGKDRRSSLGEPPAARVEARNAALEEAAKVADGHVPTMRPGRPGNASRLAGAERVAATKIAAAIRALAAPRADAPGSQEEEK